MRGPAAHGGAREPSGPVPGRIALSLEPLKEVLQPGGTPRRVEVTLRNDGPEVEQVEIRPVGPLAPWVTLEESVVRIWPQEQTRFGLSVQIPSGPAAAAGSSVLALAARTGDGARAEAQVPAEIAVRVEVDLQVPDPHAIETPRLAEVGLHLGNRSNVPVQVVVSATDREGLLRQKQPRPSFRLVPGGTAGVGLGLSCRKLLWRGRARSHEYTVRADIHPFAPVPPTGPTEPVARAVTGVLVQTPLLRVWWLLLWVVLVLVVWVMLTSSSWGLLLLFLISLTLSWSGFLVVRVLHGLLVVRRERSAAAPPQSFPRQTGP